MVTKGAGNGGEKDRRGRVPWHSESNHHCDTDILREFKSQLLHLRSSSPLSTHDGSSCWPKYSDPCCLYGGPGWSFKLLASA